ncbi:MAG: response regulator [Anaerolineae bacterium]|nr:response regulator [Anaerolineae bacterium]
MPHILLIEDNPGNAEMILHILRTAGYEVRHFDRGAPAASSARTDMPMLILMDFNLPDIDGRTLTLILRKQLGINAPPIIACSARTGEQEVALAYRFGCSAFLRKPFTPNELLDIVRRYVPEHA